MSPGTQVYGQGCAEPDGALSAMIERVLTAQGFAPHPVGRQLLAPEQQDEQGDEGSEGVISVTAGLGVSGHRAEDGRLYLLGLGTPNRTLFLLAQPHIRSCFCWIRRGDVPGGPAAEARQRGGG